MKAQAATSIAMLGSINRHQGVREFGRAVARVFVPRTLSKQCLLCGLNGPYGHGCSCSEEDVPRFGGQSGAEDPRHERCTAFQSKFIFDNMTPDSRAAGYGPRVVDCQGRRKVSRKHWQNQYRALRRKEILEASVGWTPARDWYPQCVTYPMRHPPSDENQSAPPPPPPGQSNGFSPDIRPRSLG